MLNLFDVIWVYDRTTNPQKWKMYVCLSNEDGWFLRINSRDSFKPCVSALKADHKWLDHDSYVECSLLMLDEFEVEDALRRDGVVGILSHDLKGAILEHLNSAKYIRDDDKERLNGLLG